MLRWLINVYLGLFLSVNLTNCLADGRPITKAHSQKKPEINWVSLDKANDEARRLNKKILIWVYVEWCGYCKIMEKKTFGNPNIIEYINSHFLAVKINAWHQKEIWFQGYKFVYLPQLNCHQLAYQLLNGIIKYPTTIIMTPTAEIISPIQGYLEPKKYLKLITFFAEDKYLTQTWPMYKSQSN